MANRPQEWALQIAPKQWRIYRQVITAAQQERVPFAIGGAFAVATYTGSWRDTKDLDLYVLPEYKERMIALLTRLGLADYYEKLPYDRWWIYRGTSDDTIVDVIWAMANHRAQIDDLWMSGPEVDLNGYIVKSLPPEALLWDIVVSGRARGHRFAPGVVRVPLAGIAKFRIAVLDSEIFLCEVDYGNAGWW